MKSAKKLKKRLYAFNHKSKNANPKVKVNYFDIIFSWDFVRFIISIARLFIDLSTEL